MTTDTDIMPWVTQQQAHFNACLERALPNTSATLSQAMRYSTLNGGKRLRPLLVYAAGECVNASGQNLDQIAVAIELIHCYSLVHDDMPAMDDDDLRRGKPSCHKAFDEATALLVGDSLQSLAFQILTHDATLPNALKITHILAKAIGLDGMAGGQSLDMQGTVQTRLDQLQEIHQLKTGALFTAAIQMAALAGNADNLAFNSLTTFSHAFGLAFQIRDDIQDCTMSEQELGKTAGKDASQNKATYPSIIGLEQSKVEFISCINKANTALKSLHNHTQLQQLLDNL